MMNHRTIYIFKVAALLLAVVAGVFMNGAGRVICREADGRVAIEMAHEPGACHGQSTANFGAVLEGGPASCLDTPLGDDGGQSLRRERNVAGDLQLLIHVAVVTYRMPVVATVLPDRVCRISIPPGLSVVRTTIFLV